MSSRTERNDYEALRDKFVTRYKRLQPLNDHRMVTPLWESFNHNLEQALLPFPPWNFLRQKTISQTMVITRGEALLDTELKTLSALHGPRLKYLVTENAFGYPPLASSELRSSHNSIHHAYHLARWQKTTGKDPATITSVVEWGGGYGNFAKLFLRQSPGATYTIIDTPLLCCLQWLYLSVVSPEVMINLVSDARQPLITSGINIIPIGLMEKLTLNAELFVSTWALSESSSAAQQAVAQRQWFGAKHLLLGFQESNPDLPDASGIERLARDAGAMIEEVPVLKRQHYAFK